MKRSSIAALTFRTQTNSLATAVQERNPAISRTGPLKLFAVKAKAGLQLYGALPGHTPHPNQRAK
ncbi:hypothetical protein [Winslowiella toletana]|uniref:hypothetical protein n=1 Tax=Winslowiella toletana TaxID=92490 RepID=UPI0028BEC728|nr:hypothetical protein [Winslowiella toletana]WNN43289.1 hypothetical protein RIN69_16530 [Winslowiella toletana]